MGQAQSAGPAVTQQGTDIVQAALKKDLAKVDRLLAEGCPADARDAEGKP